MRFWDMHRCRFTKLVVIYNLSEVLNLLIVADYGVYGIYVCMYVYDSYREKVD